MLDLNQVWENILTDLRKSVRHEEVEIWFGDAQFIERQGEHFIVEVPNKYYVEWIEENYQKMLDQSASAHLKEPCRIKCIGREEPTAEVPLNEDSKSVSSAYPRALGVNRNQTFANFVVGGCNQFASAAAEAIVNQPGQNYNPLFIYGASGLGKTHLMHAIGNEVVQKNPEARVVYVTSEDFMNEMIQCLRLRKMEDFRSKYRRRASVLLIDDVQFLSGRERTQEEFFHTFNALQAAGRQIVLTSDVEPARIESLEPRLKTRFNGGLLADMQAPEHETLLSILQQKAKTLDVHVPLDLAEAICNVIQGNIRELEGLLNRLKAQQRFFGEPLTLEFAERALQDVFKPQAPHVTVPMIIEAVANIHNIRSSDLTGTSRQRSLTRPRQIAYYLARTHTSLSFPELGREFGGRDHSTIQHGCRRVQERVDQDPDLTTRIVMIEDLLHLRSTRRR